MAALEQVLECLYGTLNPNSDVRVPAERKLDELLGYPGLCSNIFPQARAYTRHRYRFISGQADCNSGLIR